MKRTRLQFMVIAHLAKLFHFTSMGYTAYRSQGFFRKKVRERFKKEYQLHVQEERSVFPH